MSQPGVTGVLCSDNQGLALAGTLKICTAVFNTATVLISGHPLNIIPEEWRKKIKVNDFYFSQLRAP